MDSAEGDSQPKATPPLFSCELRLLPEDGSSDYLAITLKAEARVNDSVADARDSFDGAVDYEKSKGRKVTTPGGVGDQAAAVTVSAAEDQQECRVHVQSSNAVLSLTMFVTGTGVDCSESPDPLLKVSESTLAVMGSE